MIPISKTNLGGKHNAEMNGYAVGVLFPALAFINTNDNWELWMSDHSFF